MTDSFPLFKQRAPPSRPRLVVARQPVTGVAEPQCQHAQIAADMHACALGRWCCQTHSERVFGAFMAEASCVRHNWRPASRAEAAVSRRGCSGSVTTPAGSNRQSLTRSSSGLATRVPGARPLTHAERVFGAFMAEASCVRHNWRPASPAEAAVSRRGCSGSVTTPAGSNWRSLTRSSLTAGDPECLERVRGRPIAVRDARRWYGRRRANRPEPAVGSAPRSLVRERVDRGPGGLLVPTGVGEPG